MPIQKFEDSDSPIYLIYNVNREKFFFMELLNKAFNISKMYIDPTI